MYTKLTPKQVEEMRRLYKEHWTYPQLAKKYKVDRSTIGYRVRNKKYKSHKNDGIGDNPNEIPLFIRQNLEKQKQAEPDNRIERNVCIICGKKKEEKWKLTNFCNLQCYGTR